MLMAIRDRFTGVLAWVIVLLISIPFVFWGIQEYLGLGRTDYALIVNGDEISNRDFQNTYQTNKQALQRSFGGKIPAYFNEAEYLRKQTLDRLINNRLLIQAAKEMSLGVGANELADKIMAMPAFQADGAFDPAIYQSTLQSIGQSRSQFENDMMNDLVTNQLAKGISATAFATEQRLVDYAKVQYQSRDIEYALLKSEHYKNDIEITDEAVSKYYEDHLSDFVSEEKVSVDYIELDIKKLKQQVEVKEDDLLQKYNETMDAGGYLSEETRDASHILLRVSEDAGEQVIAAKQKEAEEIYQRLKSGESFAELAKSHSEDPGSAQQGGSLDTVERGVMVKPFEDALFDLSEAEPLSKPVRTTFGFHIIKLDKINSEQKIPFAQVRDTLEEEYRQQEAEKNYYDLFETLSNVAFESGDSLEPAAKATGIAVASSAKFTKVSGQGIASSVAVRNAAFSEDALENRYNSEPIELGESHVVVLRVKEHEPSVQRTLQQVKAEITNTLRQQTIDQRMTVAAEDLLEAAKRSGLSESILKTYNAEVQKVEGLKRDNRETPYEIVTAAFKMGKPDSDAEHLSVSKTKLRDGSGYAVIVLRAINDGDIAWIENEQKSQALKQLETANAASEFEALLASLKADAEIVINPELQE